MFTSYILKNKTKGNQLKYVMYAFKSFYLLPSDFFFYSALGWGLRGWSNAYLGPWCFLHIMASYMLTQRDANPVCAEWRHTH